MKIKLKGLMEENFQDYKKASLFLAFPHCDFKCCREMGVDISICQNSHLNKEPIEEVDLEYIWALYDTNILTEAFVFGGMEVLDSFDDVLKTVKFIREKTNDDIVIYTGYYEYELESKIEILKQYPNIIIKFGRFLLNSEPRYSETLGVTLISSNQYAKKIS